MLKKVTIGLAALATAGFAGSAMATPPNPWAPVNVPVTITVQPMVELWSEGGNVPLEVVDAGSNQGSANAASKILFHLHNVPVNISASISSDIPEDTQFHILVNPSPSWTSVATSGAQKVISWRRDGATYQAGATGVPAGSVTVTGPGIPAIALSPAANNGYNSSSPEAQATIAYFADAPNFMPDQATKTFDVVWTIAPQ